MSESLRNDGRVWVPKNPKGDSSDLANELIPDDDRDYFLERQAMPAFGNLVHRATSAARERPRKPATKASVSARPKLRPSISISRDTIKRDWCAPVVKERSTATSSRCMPSITGEDPYSTSRCGSTPPSITRWAACGWTTTCMSSTIPGLVRASAKRIFRITEPTDSAPSALMQGLADGYFVHPVHDRPLTSRATRSRCTTSRSPNDHPEVRGGRVEDTAKARVTKMLGIQRQHVRVQSRSIEQLGKIMWEKCGMARNEAGLKHALNKRSPRSAPRVLEQRPRDGRRAKRSTQNLPGTRRPSR